MVTYLPQQSKLSRIKGSWVPQEKKMKIGKHKYQSYEALRQHQHQMLK